MSATNCPICNSPWHAVEKTCRSEPYVGKKLPVRSCTSCSFTQPVHALVDGRTAMDPSSKEPGDGAVLRSSRNANELRPGREFHMTELGYEILNNVGKPPTSLTYFGAGSNTDHRWISQKHPSLNIKLVDLENYQKHDAFEPINQASPSNLVIACEVIEHFHDPMAHFESLFRIVDEEGLLICSTNINDGSDIELHNYPFINGHSAYWSPISLMSAAAKFGYFVDFRTPKLCFSKKWIRKRYVLFYKSMQVQLGISAYFGQSLYAPSE